MACPTCDHTMQNIGNNHNETVFWCSRCGTIKFTHSGECRHDISVPLWVRRFAPKVNGIHEIRDCKEFDRVLSDLSVNLNPKH